MNALRQRSPLLMFALLAAAVCAAELLAARQVAASPAPGVLAAAILFDLAVALPAAYWWFFVRGRAPLLRVAPAVALGLAVAWAILPAEGRGVFASAHLVLIPLEVAVAGMVVRALFRSLRSSEGDAIERISAAAHAVVPYRAAAAAVAYEITLVYLALLAWRARPSVPPGAAAFSAHRRSGYTGLVFAVVVASVVEGVVLHLLVARWSVAAAWVLSAISAYGAVWMVGDLQAIRLRPTLVTPDALAVRVGLRWNARLPWSEIASVEPRGRTPFPRRAAGHLRATPMGEPSFVITLRNPVRVSGPYGITRTVTRIGVTVDDVRGFETAVHERLNAPR